MARTEESLIGAVTFLQLPLTFLSTAFMQPNLMPGWISAVGRLQPGRLGDYGPAARRSAPGPTGPRWGSTAVLAAFAFACLVLATKAFKLYQAQV